MPEPSRRRVASIPPLFILAGLVAPATATGTRNHMEEPTPGIDLARLQLRALNHRFMHEALDPAGAWLEATTAADFLHTAADGQWHARSAFIAQRRRQPPPGDARLVGDVVRLYGQPGGVALVHGLYLAPEPAAQRIRFTDVYAWQGGNWQRVSAQDTALKDGVAVSMNLGTAPTISAWQGADPIGDESRVLHELNEHYVRAFRECDIAWYDAHLSADYCVISGDGSLNDRATALSHFARPVFATSMRHFPVGRVQVRRFGEVALIHAENDYELKDGRRGVSRYCDIWVLQEGRWLCIAAHITTHRAPA